MNRTGALTAQHTPHSLILPLLKRGWRGAA